MAHHLTSWYGSVRPVDVPAAGPPAAPHLPPGRLVDVPGRGQIPVRELAAASGGGPTILLLHGWMLAADLNWFALYGTFARHGTVLAMDIRGHGRGIRAPEPFTLEAAADDAAALLDHLGTGPAVVVGYSMGGSVGLELCRRHPEHVAGLVLLSTALQWREERDEQVLWRLMGPLELVLRVGVPGWITDRYLARAVRRNPALAPVAPWIRTEAFRGRPADLAEAGRALGRFDARPYAPLVAVPTAVVVSRRDRLVAPYRQFDLARAIPGARTVEADVGHSGWLVQPDRVGEAMDTALAHVVGRLPRRRPAFRSTE
ncbi:MAG TPA: alpha/beta hydrolase [Acidimicrobiales bacterium]|nr:alpha/beta hydrolase [Acidimicrobiales bacterium]